ncbi:MAG: hypothetical protein KJ906_01175 [Nanoarchaeota archaeon]|nr:hypothetical protein [Nanoarchaeota archaeon]
MNDLLTWLYGKSGRNKHIRDMAQKVIEILKTEQSMDYQELCKALDIGFTEYQKPKRTFYFVVNPLKKVQLIQEKRVYEDGGKKKYKTHYYLSPDRFLGFMTKTVQDFHSHVK